MMLRRNIARVRNSVLTLFIRDARAAAAVEFAVIAPVILTVFFGSAEVSSMVAADRKVTILSRTVSDLVAQSTTISNTDISNIFTASKAILTPYANPPADLRMRVSAININATGTTATVAWSDASGTDFSAHAKDAVITTIPAALKIANSQLIWSEVEYDYKSPTGQYIVGELKLTDQFFARPRQSVTICRPEQNVTTCS